MKNVQPTDIMDFDVLFWNNLNKMPLIYHNFLK